MESMVVAGAYSYTQQLHLKHSLSSNAHLPVVRDEEAEQASGNAAGGQTSVSLSVSTQLTYSSQRSHTFAADGVEKYQAIEEQPTTTQAASTILGFIELQLQRDIEDGATPEELQSRLEAGMQGFIKGYTEASEQLVSMGLLTEDVESAIEQTYDDVIAGIADIANKMGLEAPGIAGENTNEPAATVQPVAVPANPGYAGGNSISNLPASEIKNAGLSELLSESPENLQELIDASALSYSDYESRSFSFDLKTQDGDTVTIRLASDQSSYANVGYVRQQGAGFQSEQASYSAGQSSSSQFYFEVEGELDEEELSAINDLLSQVNEVSETFFGGDVFTAFEQAINIGFDSDEIARFSLNLKQETVTQVNSTYGQVAGYGAQDEDSAGPMLSPIDSKISQLSNFIKQLEEARLFADKMGIGTAVLADMAEYMSHQQLRYENEEQKQELFKPYVQSTLESLAAM